MAEEKQGEKSFEYSGGEIRLDKEGRWFHEGVEITHPRTVALFSRSVQKDEDGAYWLVVGWERARIVVEDTPFVVRSVSVDGGKAILRLNDGTEEELNPSTLRISRENVLYCDVKGGEYPARFLRPAYYQLMAFLEETKEGYALRLGDRLWPIAENNSPPSSSSS